MSWVARGELVQALAHLHVAGVGRDLEAGVGEAVRLFDDGGDHRAGRCCPRWSPRSRTPKSISRLPSTSSTMPPPARVTNTGRVVPTPAGTAALRRAIRRARTGSRDVGRHQASLRQLIRGRVHGGDPLPAPARRVCELRGGRVGLPSRQPGDRRTGSSGPSTLQGVRRRHVRSKHERQAPRLTVNTVTGSADPPTPQEDPAVDAYAEGVMQRIEAKNPDQPEFLQAVTQVVGTLEPVLQRCPAVPGGQDPRAPGRARAGDHLPGQLGRRPGRDLHQPWTTACR